jgi:ABC-2 type transport system permease protein
MMIRQELRLLIRDSLLVWVGLFVAAIFAVSFWSGASEKRSLLRKTNESHSVIERQRSELLNAMKKIEAGSTERFVPDPTSASAVSGRMNPYVLKLQERLAITAIGEGDVRPSLVRLGNPMDPTYVQDDVVSPLAMASGRLDLVFGVVVLIPLAVIAMMFRLFSGEKETGVLPLIQSGERSLWYLLAERSFLRFACLALLVGLSFVAGLALTQTSPGLELIIQWLFVVVSYLGFWFTMCYFVSCFKWTTGANLVILISAWLFLVVLVPAIANLVVSKAHKGPLPISTRMKLRATMEHGEADVSEVRQFYLDYGLNGFRDDNLPARSLALRNHALKQVLPDMLALRNSAIRREQSLSIIGLFNPAILANEQLVRLAGKDGASFRDFEDYLVRENDRRFRHFLPLRLNRTRLSLNDYREIPLVSVQTRQRSQVAFSSVSILGWCLALAAASAFAVRIKQ